ncbi:MAG: dihydroorotase [Bacteroidia bacterium]|nr:dihydroorotase [Bacteroidia bacterium]
MNLLIKSARIVDPQSPHSGKVKDILVENGKIVSIKANIKANKAQVFDAKGKYISPGWFDMNVNLCDPGYEHREDIQSGCKAAMYGGFTGIACTPNTNPSPDTKSQIEYIKKATAGNLIDVYPIASLSKGSKGEELAEMFDLDRAGAIAFADGDNPVKNAGLMLRALQYAKSFNGLIFSNPTNLSLSPNGNMNEGPTSTKLGLKGIPSIAEEIMVSRDLSIAEYAESSIHFTNISTTGSVELIKEAKKKGIKVTAETNVLNLVFDDEKLQEFNTNYKVNPPLRDKKDTKALIKAVNDNTIDIISSNHSPKEEELKKCEFDNAAFGIINLQTAFPLLNTYLQKSLKLDTIITKIAITPRKNLNIEVPGIQEKSNANFTIFDTTTSWVFEENDIKSKSKNSPFIGTKFLGKATAVMNNKKFQIL